MGLLSRASALSGDVLQQHGDRRGASRGGRTTMIFQCGVCRTNQYWVRSENRPANDLSTMQAPRSLRTRSAVVTRSFTSKVVPRSTPAARKARCRPRNGWPTLREVHQVSSRRRSAGTTSSVPSPRGTAAGSAALAAVGGRAPPRPAPPCLRAVPAGCRPLPPAAAGPLRPGALPAARSGRYGARPRPFASCRP